MAHTLIHRYLTELDAKLRGTIASDASGAVLDLDGAAAEAGRMARAATGAGGTIFFIGNGGSAGIASHMAIDFSKSGGMRALAFNDGSYLTCLGNDYGFEHVFSKALDLHARAGDLVIAISSSGRSANILNGVATARGRGCKVVTFSGFSPDNALRRQGDVNFYLASGEYGLVEVGHLALVHAVLDLAMGWGRDSAGAKASRAAE